MDPFQEFPDVLKRIEKEDQLTEDIQGIRRAQEQYEMRENAEVRQDIRAIREDIRAIRELLQEIAKNQNSAHSE